jgi:hypothetical protein
MSASSLKDPKATMSRGGSSRRRMNQLLQSNRSSKSSETIHLSPYFLNSSSSVLLPIGGSVRSILFDPPAAKLGTKPAAVLLLMTCSHRSHAARAKEVETQRCDSKQFSWRSGDQPTWMRLEYAMVLLPMPASIDAKMLSLYVNRTDSSESARDTDDSGQCRRRIFLNRKVLPVEKRAKNSTPQLTNQRPRKSSRR